MRKTRAFTLVELLVVIGIIALLISVLLPALSAARRQANTVKCATALREIGNAFLMYSNEYKGYAPVAKTKSNYTITFNSTPPVDYTGIQYWPNFLARYVTKSKMGNATLKPGEQANARSTVFWGCPAFDGYQNASYAGGVNVLQMGYGMNGYPEYTASYPPIAAPPNVLGDSGFSSGLDGNAVAVVSTADSWRTLSEGKWYKLRSWTRASERMLVADGRFWIVETQAAPLNKQVPGQGLYQDQQTWGSPNDDGQTLYDFYRHGKFPTEILGSGNTARYSPNGGKVAFNILYADGHVSTSNLREEAYHAARMRFPG
jgi:prepilin-type N-terminal cleavage/methylation domain-containing protein/prepilin-type processing-associated H-X9-DG protein